MKYLQLLFILILISACSGTKRVVEPPQNEISKVQKPTDSIIETKKEAVDEQIDTISKIEKDTVIKDSVNLDETLTKLPAKVHDSWNTLLKKHVSDKGNVDYKSFKKDHNALIEYFKVLQTTIPNEKTSRAYNLSYWINAYNAFTIDLILRNYPIKSIKDIKDPWEQRLWKLGEKWYNLNDIEHQILRKMNEPRIHFAIVCASYSCPKLLNEAFTPEKLEVQLTKSTSDFLNDSERNTISENSLELSKIFQWFAKDFKQNGTLIDFLNKYSDIKISSKAKKSFKDYNWDLNE